MGDQAALEPQAARVATDSQAAADHDVGARCLGMMQDLGYEFRGMLQVRIHYAHPGRARVTKTFDHRSTETILTLLRRAYDHSNLERERILQASNDGGSVICAVIHKNYFGAYPRHCPSDSNQQR